jgi:hypothetical protein
MECHRTEFWELSRQAFIQSISKKISPTEMEPHRSEFINISQIFLLGLIHFSGIPFLWSESFFEYGLSALAVFRLALDNEEKICYYEAKIF